MPLQDSGSAPYAPTAAVTKALDAYRDGGVAITATNLTKLGVTDSIAPRTIQTFKLLDLLDDAGNPTQALIDFKQASSETYKERLAESLRAAYAPVFAVIGPDPSLKTPDQITDAFRTYTPDSLRDRMVNLFLGLCEYVGIVDEAPARKPGPKSGRSTPKAARPKTAHKPETIVSPAPPQHRGGTYTVKLRSAGEVTVSYSADLWDLSADDRDFLFQIIDKVKSYEAQRQLPAAAPGAEGAGV